jgi:hypothetical protein
MSEASTLGKWGAAISENPRILAHGGQSSGGRIGGRFQVIIQCKIPMRGILESRTADDVLVFKDDCKDPLDSRLAIPSLKKFVRHFSRSDTLISCRRSRMWQRAKGAGPCGPIVQCASRKSSCPDLSSRSMKIDILHRYTKVNRPLREECG